MLLKGRWENGCPWAVVLLCVVTGAILIRLLAGQPCRIPSSSMENALIAGDYVWLDKFCYGAKLPQRFADIPLLNAFTWIGCLRKTDLNNHWKYIRLPGMRRPALFDVAVFESPDRPGVWVVKRISGLPSDTVRISRGRLKINGSEVDEPPTVIRTSCNDRVAFPPDTSWTIQEYGPLVIPASGARLVLTDKNYEWIRLVAAGEGNRLEKGKNGYLCNEQPVSSYRFEQNYYFMLGDNRANSLDSRYIGLIPESALVGVVHRVLFSIDSDRPFFRSIRFNRIFKQVH